MARAPFIIHKGVIAISSLNDDIKATEVCLETPTGQLILLYKNEHYDELLGKIGQTVKLLGWQYSTHFMVEYYRVLKPRNQIIKQRRV